MAMDECQGDRRRLLNVAQSNVQRSEGLKHVRHRASAWDEPTLMRHGRMVGEREANAMRNGARKSCAARSRPNCQAKATAAGIHTTRRAQGSRFTKPGRHINSEGRKLATLQLVAAACTDALRKPNLIAKGRPTFRRTLIELRIAAELGAKITVLHGPPGLLMASSVEGMLGCTMPRLGRTGLRCQRRPLHLPCHPMPAIPST